MLDVHPPHESVHSWKDFFIHIATIVIGLLIAIGLEQTVEYFHHLHVQHETRERIRAEIKINQRILAADQKNMLQILAILNRDISLLRALQHGGQRSTEKLDFDWTLQGFYDSAFNSARDSGAMALMPYEEAAMYSDAYGQQEFAMSAVIDYIKQVEADKALTQRGHTEADLTPAEIEELLAACSATLGKAHYFELNIDTLSEELRIALSDQSIQRNGMVTSR